MTKLQIFDPAIVLFDRYLRSQRRSRFAALAADIAWLKSKGVEVERYNLAQQVAAFWSTATSLRYTTS